MTSQTFHCDPTSDRWVELAHRGTPTLVATHPVTRGEYKDYFRDAGRPIPPALARIAPPAAPVTDVSQVDAKAYCEWLAHREGGEFRLPSVGELMELAQEAEAEGITTEVWPHQHGNRFEVRGGLATCICANGHREVEEGPATPHDRACSAASSTRPGYVRKATRLTRRRTWPRRKGFRSSPSG